MLILTKKFKKIVILKILQLIFFRGVKTYFGVLPPFSGVIKIVLNNNNVINFDQIKIQTCLAPQNDRQHLIFVKDIYVDAEK